MIKTLCLLALVALAASQSASDLTSALSSGSLSNASGLASTLNSTALANSPVATALSNLSSTLSNVSSGLGSAALANVSNALGNATAGSAPLAAAAAAASNVNVSSLPLLSDVTVGYGNRDVNLTRAANNSGDNWLSNYEYLNVERFSGNAGENEWNLGWVVENGDQYALWDQNGEVVLVDWQNSVWNVVDNLGSDATLGPQLSSGSQQLVDAAYNNTNVSTVSTQQVAGQASSLVNSVLGSGQLNNFLGQQGQSAQSTVGSVVSSAVNANGSQ